MGCEWGGGGGKNVQILLEIHLAKAILLLNNML